MANRKTNEHEINCNDIKNFFRNLFQKCTCCYNDDEEKKKMRERQPAAQNS